MAKRRPLTIGGTACAVEWCMVIAEPESRYCPIHREYAALHPEPLTDEDYRMAERLALGEAICDRCAGSGDCPECKGEGQRECTCHDCGDTHDAECSWCDGSGQCEECHGQRVVKPSGPATTDPDWWRYAPEYRKTHGEA